MIRRLFPILFLLVLYCSACGGEEKRELRFTLAERERLDDMVTADLDSLRPLLSAYCDTTFSSRVDAAVDSIVQRRLEEEARLRARIPQALRDDR